MTSEQVEPFSLLARSPLLRCFVQYRLYYHSASLRFDKSLKILQMSHEIPYFGRDQKMTYKKTSKKLCNTISTWEAKKFSEV